MCMTVRLFRPWENHPAGAVLHLIPERALDLVRRGVAEHWDPWGFATLS